MSTEHIVQFTYGDDGIDPMFMDDDASPVSFHRLFTLIIQKTKSNNRNSKLMTPKEIRDGLKKALS